MLEVVNEVDFCLWIVTRKWSNNIAEYSCNSQVQIPSDILAFVFLTILLSLILCVNAHGGSLLEFFNKIDFCLWIVTRKQSNNVGEYNCNSQVQIPSELQAFFLTIPLSLIFSG